MIYTPSLWRIGKYTKYLSYYIEFLRRNDFRSIRDSIKYVAFKKLPKKQRKIQTEMGKFMLRPNTTDFQFVNFSYEKEIKNYLESIKSEMGAFIDIGACIGEYCIWMGKSGIKSFAIEPVNYKAIERNISLNLRDLRNLVEILPFALGGEYKRVAFNVIEGVTSSSYMDDSGEGEMISCYKFDDIFSMSDFDQTKITVIKLDVEGMELEVLDGAESFIKNTSNLHIIYEYTSIKGGDKTIRNKLRSMGRFTFIDLDGVNTLAVKLDS